MQIPFLPLDTPLGDRCLAGLAAAGLALACGPAWSQSATVVEYYNRTLDHYFITQEATDIAALDTGQLPGWARTGEGFSAFTAPGVGLAPVCRYYIPPALGDSHFFSGFAYECGIIPTAFPSFILESAAAFYIALPDDNGQCAAGTIPVYRLWNQRADSNHRYTTDASIRAQMLARGYVAEGKGPDGVAMCSGTSSPAFPLSPAVTFEGPLVITKGGTYTGNWESQDPTLPAITIATTEPVTVENCILRSRNDLFNVSTSGVNVTVRNCYGYGLDPGADGQARGAFFEAFDVSSLDFENNYGDHVGEGVTLIGYGGTGTGAAAVTIRYNRFRNLMGLYSDGHGGVHLSGDLGNEGNGNHGVIMDKLQQLPGAEIAWNEFVMDPYVSSVGDKVNLYKSSGTQATPIVVHDNYFHGGYGIFPNEPNYSGGGVITDGGPEDTVDISTAFVQIHDNQFVNMPNFGVSIAAGHDVEAWNNRGVSTGQLDDGSWMAAPYGNAFVVWNGYGQDAGVFFNDVIHDSVAGWVVELTDQAGERVPPARRQDYYLPDCASASSGASLCTGNRSLPDPVTAATEQAEYATWLAKQVQAGVTVGPSP